MKLLCKTVMMILASVFAIAASAENVAIKFDSAFSMNLLEEICSGNPIDENAIRNSEFVADMVSHFGAMRSDFTLDAYLDARRAASNCETVGRDIFRFGEVIEKQTELKEQLQSINQNEASFEQKASQLISPLAPADLGYQGDAVLMIGTPSCGGWSVGSTFYVDVPCLRGDQRGLLYLVAHESYHGVQDLFMERVEENGSAVLSLLDAVVREGTAQYLVDFSQIENPGFYAGLNQKILKTNSRRLKQNFDLLEILLLHLSANDDDATYQKAYSIGVSGMFDSPLYSVGEEVTRVLVSRYSLEEITCLMKLPPQYFFIAYERSVSAEQSDIKTIALPKGASDTLHNLSFSESNLQSCMRE